VGDCLARFCDAQGLEDPPLGAPVVEAFCVQGLAGRTNSTKGTYRSVLRRVGAVDRPRRSTPFAGAPAKAPYSATERAALVAIARAQPKAWRGVAALMVVCLGVGAGLRAGEIAEVACSDVSRDAHRVHVSVRGPRARTTLVEPPFGAMVADQVSRAGEGYLFCPGDASRHYHNFINCLCSSLVADPDAPKLSVARSRSSYICDQIGRGTSWHEILEATGIKEVESLLRYARHVEGAPTSKAELRRRLRLETR
jgi:hypothetical protein